MGLVAGVDGCRRGWLVVLRPLTAPEAARALLCPTFADVLAIRPEPELIAVDMPIGLPERGGPGGRPCDVAARAGLGQRQSAVFAVPARAAVMCADYREACRVALLHSEPPRKVSKQTFNLFAKIREVDAALSPDLQARVVECHPEVAFWAMNGRVALDQPKKVKSRPFEPGLELRRGLLEMAGYDRNLLQSRPFPATAAGADDLLDATACSWTAARIARGDGICFPAEPERDGRGLRMEIWG